MRTSSLEVADIFRAAGTSYRLAQAGHLSLAQLKVMSAIQNCRTAALGGHVDGCDDCGRKFNVHLEAPLVKGASMLCPRPASLNRRPTVPNLPDHYWVCLPAKRVRSSEWWRTKQTFLAKVRSAPVDPKYMLRQ